MLLRLHLVRLACLAIFIIVGFGIVLVDLVSMSLLRTKARFQDSSGGNSNAGWCGADPTLLAVASSGITSLPDFISNRECWRKSQAYQW
eukprot:COSAG01_NODE_3147_length_6515_cov_3.711347_4_plen_89_part_00